MKRQPFTMTDLQKSRQSGLPLWTVALVTLVGLIMLVLIVWNVSSMSTQSGGPVCEGSGPTSFCHVDIPSHDGLAGCEWLFDIDHGTMVAYQECES